MHITRITNLSLFNFRNHVACDLFCDAPFVVIVGANGAGKTNILEAVSLLTVGRGFRNATPSMQRNHHNDADWAVRATLRHNAQESVIATGNAPTPAHDKRVIKVNGEMLMRQHALLDLLNVVWFLPTMSHLFQEGMTTRRKYLDRMVFTFDKEHASRIHAYEHYMRERRKLLAMQSSDNVWITGLEKKLSQYTVAIGYARLDALTRLTQALQYVDPVFPQASMCLSGDAETYLQSGHAALDVEARLCESLAYNRTYDRSNGRCRVGAHKTQFEVRFLPSNMPAEQCSTGEQKALLLSLLLAQIYAHKEWFDRAPIVLLDEIVAHLDVERRDALFRVLHDAEVQVWATGTDSADFTSVALKDACVFKVRDGTVQPCR